MNPKELSILYYLLENFSAEFYARGQEDQKNGKTLEKQAFSLSPARKLEIKTFLSKQQNRR